MVGEGGTIVAVGAKVGTEVGEGKAGAVVPVGNEPA